jgi:minor extracellular serine protease Vpr
MLIIGSNIITTLKMKAAFIFLVLFVAQDVFGQDKLSDVSSKYSAALKLFIASEQKDPHYIEIKNGIQYIPVFIELEQGAANIGVVQKAGVDIRTVTGTIATASIPFSQLAAVALLPSIKRIELPLLFRRNSDTLMQKFTTVDRVLGGNAPLTKPYTGEGVVIGIIDDGIEFGHPYFLDAAGKTTINAIWNMDYIGNPPSGYNYGTLWEKDSLNSFLNSTYNTGSLLQFQRKFGSAGHGTAVASLAAGKNGVAPGAEIIAVALTAFLDTLLRSDRIVDGIAFINDRAKKMGKKCVINISLGTQWGGPHDGKTLVERAIDSLCTEEQGLLVCTSAGNDGNSWKHWGGFQIHPDSSFGLAKSTYEGAMYFSIPKQHSSSLLVSITDSRAPNFSSPAISRDSILYQTPFLRIDSIIQSPVPISFTSHLKNGIKSASITFSASHANSEYDELIITLKEYTSPANGLPDLHVNRFIFKGSGMVHGYFPFLNLHPLYVFGNNPYPNDSTYRSTDCDYSTIIPTHAFSVLSSGAYNIRECYVNRLQNKVINAYPSCQLTYFTSRGPTFDGRIKPDVVTPGENVLSARSRWSDFLGHEFILDPNYQMFSGTSASSPITAGIAALVWQKFPSYTRDSIIQRIKSTAYNDNYTTDVLSPVPNNRSGWGKADAFKALTGVDTELSNECRQQTICKIDDIPILPSQSALINNFIIYPNPSNGTVFVKYSAIDPLVISVYNALGQLVHTTSLPAAPGSQVSTLRLSHLANGLYFFRCMVNKVVTTKTINISK